MVCMHVRTCMVCMHYVCVSVSYVGMYVCMHTHTHMHTHIHTHYTLHKHIRTNFCFMQCPNLIGGSILRIIIYTLPKY